MAAATSGSPVNVGYLHVRVDTASGGLSGSVYYLCTINFDVEFYQRVELELSLWSKFVTFQKNEEKKSLGTLDPAPPVKSLQVKSSEDQDVKRCPYIKQRYCG